MQNTSNLKMKGSLFKKLKAAPLSPPPLTDCATVPVSRTFQWVTSLCSPLPGAQASFTPCEASCPGPPPSQAADTPTAMAPLGSSASQGKWGPVALAGCSCAIAVERCYDLGKVSDREAIVAELAAKYKEIEAKYYGSSLLAR